jgi:hypothetical protein
MPVRFPKDLSGEGLPLEVASKTDTLFSDGRAIKISRIFGIGGDSVEEPWHPCKAVKAEITRTNIDRRRKWAFLSFQIIIASSPSFESDRSLVLQAIHFWKMTRSGLG